MGVVAVPGRVSLPRHPGAGSRGAFTRGTPPAPGWPRRVVVFLAGAGVPARGGSLFLGARPGGAGGAGAAGVDVGTPADAEGPAAGGVGGVVPAVVGGDPGPPLPLGRPGTEEPRTRRIGERLDVDDVTSRGQRQIEGRLP